MTQTSRTDTPARPHCARRLPALPQLAALLLLLLLLAPGLARAQAPAASPPPPRLGFAGSGEVAGYVGHEDDVFRLLDDYWGGVFDRGGRVYQPPDVVQVLTPLYGPCGVMRPYEENAFYCEENATVYLFPQYMERQTRALGDYAAIAIIGHEWGHHLQALLQIPRGDSRARELQADCLGGAFMAEVEAQGLLEEGDFLEALDLSRAVGDDTLGLPEDAPGAHGSAEQRIKALLRGYGVYPNDGCGLPLAAPDGGKPGAMWPPAAPAPTTAPLPLPGPVSVVAQVPLRLPLAYADCFRIDGEGARTFNDITVSLGDSVDARRRMEVWGWQRNQYRQFGCDTPPSGHAGWVEISANWFATDLAAQQALDYFAGKRMEGTDLVSAAPPANAGDAAVAMTGPAGNGTEYTAYVVRGPALVRITGVAPAGDPAADVAAIALAVAGPRGQ